MAWVVFGSLWGGKKNFFLLWMKTKSWTRIPSPLPHQVLPTPKKFMKLTEKSNVLKRSRLDPPHPLTHPKMTPLKKKKKKTAGGDYFFQWTLYLAHGMDPLKRASINQKRDPHKRWQPVSVLFVCLLAYQIKNKRRKSHGLCFILNSQVFIFQVQPSFILWHQGFFFF